MALPLPGTKVMPIVIEDEEVIQKKNKKAFGDFAFPTLPMLSPPLCQALQPLPRLVGVSLAVSRFWLLAREDYDKEPAGRAARLPI